MSRSAWAFISRILPWASAERFSGADQPSMSSSRQTYSMFLNSHSQRSEATSSSGRAARTERSCSTSVPVTPLRIVSCRAPAR